MKRFSKILMNIGLSVLTALTLVACSEMEEVGEYDNWKSRNDQFIDSISKVCDANADGKWQKIVAYTLNDTVEAISPDKNHYIYVHKELAGTGTYGPLFNDSIRVHYELRLIPSKSYSKGYMVQKTFNGDVLDYKTDVPALLGVSGNISGFITAVLNMHEGDRWTVYIPYTLGYGTSGSSIPAYSTLIYDMQLARIYRYMIDTDRTWY